MTPDLAALALHESYTASNNVIISDGTGLFIANIGSFTLPSLPTPLLFTNVLRVSAMSKKLISVYVLCVNNHVNVMFFYSFFQVQDHHSLVGQHKDDVYCWPKFVPLRSSTLVLSSSVQSSFSIISIWHSRLSHPSLHIFLKFLSVLNISFPEDHLYSFSCTSCNINKSDELSFAQSNITSSSPLDVIFSDVWTSHVSSSNGFHFYVIFVDHYTKYIWFYPLRRKSDVHSIFVTFKQLVENYFTTTIKTLYTDNWANF